MSLDDDPPDRTTRFVLVDDDRLPRDAVKEVLRRARRGYEVVAEARLPEEALPLIERCAPDVVILDLRFEESACRSGVELIIQLRNSMPEVRIIALSAVRPNRDTRRRCFEAGASAYLSKDTSNEDLLAVVDLVVSGADAWAPPPEPQLPGQRLTRRESDVLRLAAHRSFVDKQLADVLGISVKTVTNHWDRIHIKTGCHTKAECIAWYRKSHPEEF